MEKRTRSARRIVLVTATVLASILALGLLLTKVSASADVCGLCHQMAPAVAAWKTSSHTKVACPSCHEEPRPWYAFPKTLAVRSAMLTRDISLALSDEPRDSAIETPTVTDATCERCHIPDRQITIRFGTLIKHSEHAKRNKSCLSCHYWTGHPKPGAEKPMLMMERCFACHNRTAGAKAPGTCDVCHPTSFDLRPVSHAPSKQWRTEHGSWALGEKQPCQICHDRPFCDSCHGVQMPHPNGWGKGDPPAHAAEGLKSRITCSKCHTAKPDLCSMCHHKGWEPKKGPWVKQHKQLVERRGASFCLQCHAPTYCYDCHKANDAPEGAPRGD